MSLVIRIRIDLAYDGTEFAGWAVQPSRRTVQGTLQEALQRVLRVPNARATVAGRTDAGVHARAQVTHVDIPQQAWQATPGRSPREPGEALTDRLNAVLPNDIVVTSVSPAPAGFDARFSAESRQYSYRISDRLHTRDPIRRTSVLWHKSELDVTAMHNAAQQLTGLRDYAAFCKPRPGATTIRHLFEFSWARPEVGQDTGLVVAQLRSDAFCHNMVRALVGAALAVGTGKRTEAWPLQMLEAGQRDPKVVVSAAKGLTLDAVFYPPEGELASRAERVRARRMAEDAIPR